VVIGSKLFCNLDNLKSVKMFEIAFTIPRGMGWPPAYPHRLVSAHILFRSLANVSKH